MTESTWVPQWPTTGNSRHTRVMASSLSGATYGCREKIASRSRPGLFLDRPFDRGMQGRTAPYRQFALGIVVDAIKALAENPELVAADADPLEAAAGLVDAQLLDGLPAHAGARTWAVHALTSYLEADEYLRDDLPGLRPVGSRAIIYRGATGDVKEMDVWGVWLFDASTSTLELRLLRQRSIDDVLARDRAFVGFVAKIAADGVAYEPDGKRYRPFIPLEAAHGPAERIRIVDIGLADASYAVLFDDSPEVARDVYKDVTAPALSELLAGGAFNPGRNCDGCYVVEGCPAVPRRPGLLGVVGLATHGRYLTHTRLAHYEICPAQYWLADEAGVPRATGEVTPASRRGLLVHAALEWLHSRPEASACLASDLDAHAGALPAVGIAVDALPDEWREVLPYLRAHLEFCPLREASEWVHPEASVVAFDNEADVVVSARPDLLRGGTEVVTWRETKTKSLLPIENELALLEQYPQVALGLVLLASGVVSPDGVGSVDSLGLGASTDVVRARVELEVLTPTGGAVWVYDTTQPDVLTYARMLLANRVDPWLLDTAFAPTPGPQCHWCPVQQWCQPDSALLADRAAVAMVVDGFRVDPDTGEILPVSANESSGPAIADSGATADTQSARPSARVRSLAESIIGSTAETADDDLPF